MHCMKQPPPPHKEHHVYIFTVNYTEDPEWTLCTTTISKINLNLTYILENMPLSETVLLHCWVTLFIISFLLWLCKQWREKRLLSFLTQLRLLRSQLMNQKILGLNLRVYLWMLDFSMHCMFVCIPTIFVLQETTLKTDGTKKNMAVALWSCDLPQSYTYKCTSCHAFVNSFKLNSE